jgi:hypothetical protein
MLRIDVRKLVRSTQQASYLIEIWSPKGEVIAEESTLALDSLLERFPGADPQRAGEDPVAASRT